MSRAPASLPAAPRDAVGWYQLALRLRDEQNMIEACAAFARAAALAPNSAEIVFGHAQACYASGLPAAHLFRQARQLAPEHLGVARQSAIAMAAEGESVAAEELLQQILQARPDWLDGHKALATMRWTAGRHEDFTASYRKACRVQRHNLALRMAWFYSVATLRDWPAARQILDEGERIIGDAQPFALARLYVACESLARHEAEELLSQTDAVRDAGVDICRIRYYLRTRQWSQAEAVGQRMVQSSAARMAWPYLSLIWRLQADTRAAWLDGSPPFATHYDLELSAAQLDELATLLRQLHTASSPYIEQSVRGGTQTDRPLFFRHEPIIQLTREKVVEAVRQYVAALPATDAAHPLLGCPREPIRFSGSWSVRLRDGGYHVSHTHPMGWISSALYISLPAATSMGAPPAGWLNFGTPPPELELELAAYQQIEPRAGRLALFPSTMWHATEPFHDGERLVVAFDVALPGGAT
jgi:tetratricopeptide (TPR) repeat protein